MRKEVVIGCVAVLFLLTGIVWAQGQGKKQINLNGGKKGNISFPHHMHQAAVKDCKVCHKDFSKKPGALAEAKKAGSLKKKQVMNKTCLKCHRANKKAGRQHGPVSCSGCHVK